jgi:KDO2-lipid IV(A) lauroyltransferase
MELSGAWKRTRHRLEFAGVRVAFALTRLLPLRAASALGAMLGTLAWSVFRVRRRVVVDNITRALGAGSEHGGPEAIGLASYRNLGRSLMEYITFGGLTGDDVRGLVRLVGREHLDGALEAGRGGVLYTGHFGNWELFGAATVAHGYPIHFLVGEQSNPRVDDLMNELRRSQGIGIISRNVALKKVMRALKDNQFVALLADQNVRKNGVFVDFLGRPASTARGPAMFAIKQGAPVICGFIRRVEGGHMATLEPPLYADPSLSGEEAVVELTQRFSDRLAEWVRRYPDEYFWAHRRWKTQPPDA